MKFSFFSYIAKDAFISLPTGERVFRFGTFWTKPYIVPDSETENKLFKKTTKSDAKTELLIFITPRILKNMYKDEG